MLLNPSRVVDIIKAARGHITRSVNTVVTAAAGRVATASRRLRAFPPTSIATNHAPAMALTATFALGGHGRRIHISTIPAGENRTRSATMIAVAAAHDEIPPPGSP